MLGGGHVRRRSLGSTFDGSPCARARRTHRKAAVNFKQGDLTSDEDMDYVPALNRVQVVEKPSVASSMSHHFGEERMTMAQKGLLQRQSLEDSCLSGEGEDMSFSGSCSDLSFKYLVMLMGHQRLWSSGNQALRLVPETPSHP